MCPGTDLNCDMNISVIWSSTTMFSIFSCSIANDCMFEMSPDSIPLNIPNFTFCFLVQRPTATNHNEDSFSIKVYGGKGSECVLWPGPPVQYKNAEPLEAV